MAESVLIDKSKAFALEVIHACKKLRASKCEGALISQFLKNKPVIKTSIEKNPSTMSADFWVE